MNDRPYERLRAARAVGPIQEEGAVAVGEVGARDSLYVHIEIRVSQRARARSGGAPGSDDLRARAPRRGGHGPQDHDGQETARGEIHRALRLQTRCLSDLRGRGGGGATNVSPWRGRWFARANLAAGLTPRARPLLPPAGYAPGATRTWRAPPPPRPRSPCARSAPAHRAP